MTYYALAYDPWPMISILSLQCLISHVRCSISPCPLSSVRCQMSDVRFPTFHVSCPRSHVLHLMSYLPCAFGPMPWAVFFTLRPVHLSYVLCSVFHGCLCTTTVGRRLIFCILWPSMHSDSRQLPTSEDYKMEVGR